MRSKLFYLVLALVITSATSVNGQVLIGGTENDNPHAGSILDLASGGQNNLGLLLPNVELNDDASEFVLVPDGTSGFETIKQTATGMIVYNIAAVQDGPGVYLWDGGKWTSLSKPSGTPLGNNCPKFIIDGRDSNKYFVGDFGDAGCWMTQNLRYIPDSEDGYTDYSHGISSDNLSEEKYYTFPGSTGNEAYPGVNNTLDDIQAAWESSEDLRKMGVFYYWVEAVNVGDEDGEYPNPENVRQGEGEVTEGPA
ncbi:MAG: hypothetical protein LBH61_00415, partial [Dysgonamonadaceae bacterium]|nr:hypothetical protein [Dysgonamonadaceae bacterium]